MSSCDNTQKNNSKKINVSDIPKNSWVKTIFEVHALWITKNGFGIFLKPVLVSFTPIEIEIYKFLEDSDDEIENVIDSENDIFMKPIKNENVNELETSNLNIQDSLEINTKIKYSSTSSEDKSSTSSDKRQNNNEKQEILNVVI